MMNNLIQKSILLIKTRTAKDLYWVFSGNILLIILTFFTTILIANKLTKAENGILLALLTLANLLSDLGEAGLGSSLSNFIPGLIIDRDYHEAKRYVSTAFLLELIIGIIIVIGIFLFAHSLSSTLFANTPVNNVMITAGMTFILILFGFSTFALSAYKLFAQVSVINIFYSLVRLALVVMVMLFAKLTLFSALMIYTLAFSLGWMYSLVFLKSHLSLYVGTGIHVRKLVGFSRFLALQKMFISLYSRLDLLMLVPLSGAVEAGVYGIASRFSLVYPLAISSLGQVLAPKFAEFGKGKDALAFFKKVSVVVGILLISQFLFVIFAQPLIVFLLPKYADSIPVFQGLIIAMIGFIISTPFVSFIIYTLRKPHITTISAFFQLIIIFFANLYFIPKFGRYAPAIGIGLGNIAMCVITISASIYYLRKEI